MESRESSYSRGFTLFELLIVIAMIGIMAAVAIPMYRSQTCKAKLTEVTNAMGAIASAVTSYYNEHGSLPQTMKGYNAIEKNLGVNVDPRILTRIKGRYAVRWKRTDRGRGGYVRVFLADKNRKGNPLSGCPPSVLGKKIVLTIDNAPLKTGDPIRWDWDKKRSTLPMEFLPKR